MKTTGSRLCLKVPKRALLKVSISSLEGGKAKLRLQLMGAGTILNEVREAATILKETYSVESDIWSLTSVNEITREGQQVDRWNLLHPESKPKRAYLTEQLDGAEGPVVIATDYMKNYAEQMRKYIEQPLDCSGYRWIWSQ